MPAAYLTTPAGKRNLDYKVTKDGITVANDLADVVKTRLQVEARKGQTHYKGLTDAFVKICELCHILYRHLLIYR